jgi:hypothetical protein
MSKTHTYRLQLHCSRVMHAEISEIAQRSGVSQSAAARALIDRALYTRNDQMDQRLTQQEAYLEAVLHTAAATRVLVTDLAQHAGVTPTPDNFRERISRIIERYKQGMV